MNNAIPNPLPRYATRYEVAATHPELPTVVVGFTRRQSKAGLLAVMRSRGGEIIEHCQIGETDEIEFKTKPRPHARAGLWKIGFTGRTEREALTLTPGR